MSRWQRAGDAFLTTVAVWGGLLVTTYFAIAWYGHIGGMCGP